MSAVFQEVASIDSPILDADAHVYEPPDVWRARVASRWRARAPKLIVVDGEETWSFGDGERLRPIGLMAAAGASYP